jgi:hypothetical protein
LRTPPTEINVDAYEILADIGAAKLSGIEVDHPPDDIRSVERLIQALRSPLPKGFCWDFRQGSTCYGLSHRLGIYLDLAIFRDVLNVDDHPFSPFERDGVVPLYRVPARDVTPRNGCRCARTAGEASAFGVARSGAAGLALQRASYAER